MKQIISLIVFLMAACIGMSQGLVVESFNLDPFDATATSRGNEVLDFNRIPCALVKVMIIDNTVNFKSDYIVRYNPRGKNEYWVYMSEGARSLIVRSDNFLPQEVVFADYTPEIKELKRGRTYVLTLSCKGESKDDRVAVTFVCNSPTAEFVIDNYQTERGIRTFRMEPGDHTVEVTAEGYQKLTTTIRVSPYMKKQEISLDLTPDKSLDKIVAEGNNLRKAKKYTQAIVKYRQAAEQGKSSGQVNLGYMYEYGYGVEKDYAEAVKWYRRAAEQGNSFGQKNLGDMYYYGYGVEKDYAEAVKWYRRAAEQGNSDGQKNLGYMYREGYGVEKDYAEAVKWYRRAAEQGNSTGQKNLGYMYREGYGVEKDYAEAVKWYRRAAEQGDLFSQHNLGEMYYYGYGVEQDYAEAVKWYRRAAEQGDSFGQYNLGCMYQKGYGVEKDYYEAVIWYRLAAEQGDSDGQNNLGYMYYNGYGVEKDYAEAVKWYRRAAEQGLAGGQNNLGYMYEMGYGVEKDCKKALYWYGEAAEQGHLDAIRSKAILEKTCK